MQIELGLTGAVALMGIAVQLRILKVLQRKLDEIQEEQKKRDEEAEMEATERFGTVTKEREEWERDHPTLGKHMRQESNYSSMPLMKDQETPATPGSAEQRGSSFTFTDGRPRYHSGVSDFFAAPTPDEELRRGMRSQSPGALPALDLGLGIKEDVPRGFIANEDTSVDRVAQDLEEIRRKSGLLVEIQELRRSIDALKAETPAPSSTDASRHPSIGSRRPSLDPASALSPGPSHLRPPREADPRGRVQSMEFSTLARSPPMLDDPISRPTSVPLRDNNWDSYIHDRKLVQPPSGVTVPISPNLSAGRPSVSPAVVEALEQRKRRESSLGQAYPSDHSDDIPLAKVSNHHHNRTSSTGGNIPVAILPPKRSPIIAPTPQRPAAARTRTFEELNERHREKMRDLQAPLTQAEREQAELEAAKQRWERSKTLEREAVTKRQAEKAAIHDQKRKRSDDIPRQRQRSLSPNNALSPHQHSRSVSGDRLAQVGSSAKRLSTMKVEDWQKYQQQDGEMGVRTDRGRGVDSRGSRAERAGVPFPDGSKHHANTHERRPR
ncbi:hypothetical protein HGRIS_008043 [Hohenbuehelia grisea]|uniref:Uncharacterized protein n=1 Tax=Hohenbuehelia grisea TaxID=104357 RepID=A0ABR3J6S6_9AGAR